MTLNSDPRGDDAGDIAYGRFRPTDRYSFSSSNWAGGGDQMWVRGYVGRKHDRSGPEWMTLEVMPTLGMRQVLVLYQNWWGLRNSDGSWEKGTYTWITRQWDGDWEDQTQGNGPGCNNYKEGTYDETYRGSRGFPHVTFGQGAYVVDANYSVYKDKDGKYNLRFFGSLQHYAQSLGESMFTAQTRLIVNGKAVGPTLTADFRPGESVYLPAGWIALGYTNTILPDAGTVQIQMTITSYFKDGQHPGVDISRDSWYFNVPVLGPK